MQANATSWEPRSEEQQERIDAALEATALPEDAAQYNPEPTTAQILFMERWTAREAERLRLQRIAKKNALVRAQFLAAGRRSKVLG